MVTVLFISIMYTAIVCTTGAVVSCNTMSPNVLSGLVVAGAIELVFEIRGLIKIYKNKRHDDETEDN